MVVKVPKISTVIKKKYQGHITISLDGKILGIGKDSLLALEDARKKMEDIDEKEFLVSRIHDDEILAV